MLEKIAAAWRWSRTIFLNVVSVLILSASAILSYLVGVDWTSVIHNPKVLFFVTIGINVANIVLRMITTTPVGGKGSQ